MRYFPDIFTLVWPSLLHRLSLSRCASPDLVHVVLLSYADRSSWPSNTAHDISWDIHTPAYQSCPFVSWHLVTNAITWSDLVLSPESIHICVLVVICLARCLSGFTILPNIWLFVPSHSNQGLFGVTCDRIHFGISWAEISELIYEYNEQTLTHQSSATDMHRIVQPSRTQTTVAWGPF